MPKTNAKHRVAHGHGLGNVVLDLQKLQFIFGVDVETADIDFANSAKSLPHSEKIKTDTNSAHAPPPAEGDLPPGRQKTSGKPEEKQKSIVKTNTNSTHAPPPAEGDLPPKRQETSGKLQENLRTSSKVGNLRTRRRDKHKD